MTSRTIDDTGFRVYYFTDELIKSWRIARDRANDTNLSFVKTACSQHLPAIVKELRSIGLRGEGGERRPVRLEVPLGTLHDLGTASEATGVPATSLLAIVLQRASVKKSGRRGKNA